MERLQWAVWLKISGAITAVDHRVPIHEAYIIYPHTWHLPQTHLEVSNHPKICRNMSHRWEIRSELLLPILQRQEQPLSIPSNTHLLISAFPTRVASSLQGGSWHLMGAFLLPVQSHTHPNCYHPRYTENLHPQFYQSSHPTFTTPHSMLKRFWLDGGLFKFIQYWCPALCARKKLVFNLHFGV